MPLIRVTYHNGATRTASGYENAYAPHNVHGKPKSLKQIPAYESPTGPKKSGWAKWKAKGGK